MRYKSFKDLPSYKDKTSKSSAPEAEKREVKKKEEQEDDLELFLQAVQDVKPLGGKGQGRQVAPENPPESPQTPPDQDSRAQKYLQDLVHGKVEFDIEMTSEYIIGHVRGFNSRMLNRLKTGEYSTQAHLDMHGMTTEQAHYQLICFMREQYLNGKRCILLIPGRGKNSPQGLGVLRQEVQRWLTQEPLKRVVLALSTAQPKHGGAGALYVLLRKFKKAYGKIFWDRILSGIESNTQNK